MNKDFPSSDGGNVLQVGQIEVLRDEVVRLTLELARERAKSELRRDLLLQARSYLLKHQNEAKPHFGRALVARLRRQIPRMEIVFWPKRSVGAPCDQRLSKAALERLILRSARHYVAGIDAVILDFSRAGQKAEGVNWRLAGVVCGRADREDALAAIRQVVVRNATTTMIED